MFKLFCQSGLRQTNTSKPVLCPSASTTCGYFAIDITAGGQKTSIYECIDSSVFMSEYEDDNRNVSILFIKL